MITFLTASTAVLTLIVIYQERKFKSLQRQVLDIFHMVCKKWRPVESVKGYHDLG